MIHSAGVSSFRCCMAGCPLRDRCNTLHTIS
jgi:hypothetical protein